MSTTPDGFKLNEEAEKALKYKSFFGGNKLEEAADLFLQAANAFKLSKQLKLSHDAYLNQADVCLRLQEKDEASNAFLNAAKVVKKTHPKEAITCLQKAVQILSEKGRFQTAANNQKQIAEIYESDLNDEEAALSAYQIAADWYFTEDSQSLGNSCLVKVAALAGSLGQYMTAVDKFETVANASVDNNLTKWSVREYLLKAGICLLCSSDYIRARNSFDRYCALDMTFNGTREYKFLIDLLDAIEAQDVVLFTDIIVEFDKLTKLDAWKTTLLLKVKKCIDQADVDFT